MTNHNQQGIEDHKMTTVVQERNLVLCKHQTPTFLWFFPLQAFLKICWPKTKAADAHSALEPEICKYHKGSRKVHG